MSYPPHDPQQQYDPRQYPPPPGWQPPPGYEIRKRRSWPRRHWFLTFVAFPMLAIVVIIVIAVAASSGSPGSSQLSGLAACETHHTVSSEEWAQIAKDPASYRGQCITVYGQVIQFDDNTGPGSFRAEAGGQHVAPQFGFVDYPTSNALFDGDAATLKPIVQDDLFTAQVTVAGSATYDTAIGGSTSAPVFRVDSVTKTGHLDS